MQRLSEPAVREKQKDRKVLSSTHTVQFTIRIILNHQFVADFLMALERITQTPSGWKMFKLLASIQFLCKYFKPKSLQSSPPRPRPAPCTDTSGEVVINVCQFNCLNQTLELSAQLGTLTVYTKFQSGIFPTLQLTVKSMTS